MKFNASLLALFLSINIAWAETTQPRWYSSEQVATGGKLFTTYCTACHGKQAEGQANWKILDSNGKLPAPPLNGSAHSWHHTLYDLRKKILEGSSGNSWGTMPPWQDLLTEEQIQSLIAYFQSLWPETVYQEWWLEIQEKEINFYED